MPGPAERGDHPGFRTPLSRDRISVLRRAPGGAPMVMVAIPEFLKIPVWQPGGLLSFVIEPQTGADGLMAMLLPRLPLEQSNTARLLMQANADRPTADPGRRAGKADGGGRVECEMDLTFTGPADSGAPAEPRFRIGLSNPNTSGTDLAVGLAVNRSPTSTPAALPAGAWRTCRANRSSSEARSRGRVGASLPVKKLPAHKAPR